jgi:hypothetical protein
LRPSINSLLFMYLQLGLINLYKNELKISYL